MTDSLNQKRKCGKKEARIKRDDSLKRKKQNKKHEE